MGIFWKTVRLIYVIKNCRPAEEGGVNVTKEQLGALILILINERYTLLRKSSKLVSLEGMSEMTEIEADEETDYSDLYRAVNSLKEELRLAVILYYIEDNKISVCVDTVRVEDNLQLLGQNNVPEEWTDAVGTDGKFQSIEGNTSNGSEIIANGGAVCKKKYLLFVVLLCVIFSDLAVLIFFATIV